MKRNSDFPLLRQQTFSMKNGAKSGFLVDLTEVSGKFTLNVGPFPEGVHVHGIFGLHPDVQETECPSET